MIERKIGACSFCSLACPFEAQVEDGDPVALEYDAASPVTAGALCARGGSSFELLSLPGRTEAPLIAGKPVRWPEALSRLADEIERRPEGSVGMVLGADATAEEAAAAARFAERCLPGAPGAIGFFSGEAAVLAEADAGPAVPAASFADVAKANAVVAIGDLFSLCPVISRRALDARYAARGNALVSVGPDAGLTARLASLKVAAVSERRAALSLLKELVAAGAKLPSAAAEALARLASGIPAAPGAAAAAKLLSAAGKVVVLTATPDPVAVRLAKLIAAALGERAGFLAVTESAAARDILGAWNPAGSLASLAEAARDGSLQGLLVLGTDVVSAAGADGAALSGLSLLAAGSPFPSPTAEAARFVLPTLLWAEKSGTWGGARREATVSGVGLARGYDWILTGLARELGADLEGGAKPPPAAAKTMSLEDAVRLAVETAEGPRALWTAREPADPMIRKALEGVFVA